jgi:hypothetical protein
MIKIPQSFNSLLIGGTVTLGLAVGAVSSVSAQNFSPDSSFVLRSGTDNVQIVNSQSSSRYRVCVRSGTTPASNNVGARLIADSGEQVVGVGRCVEIQGARIQIVPARALGGFQRVSGNYSRLN